MGNTIDKIANNKAEILSGATFLTVLGYIVYEAI